MANELAESSTFKLDFKPAELAINNYEEMKELVSNYSDKYKDLVFEPEDKRGLSQARQELLALRNALDAERKNVKAVYNEPLKEFEDKIKDLTSMIDVPLDRIREGINSIDEAEREARSKELKAYLAESTKGKDITIEDIEISDKWLNKGNWTEQYEPKDNLKEEVENAIKTAELEKDYLSTQKRVLEEFCKNKGIDSAGWIAQLGDKDAMEIIDIIHRETERPPAEPEVNTDKPSADDEIVIDYTITNTIEVTGTISQLTALNEYLINSGITVRQV